MSATLGDTRRFETDLERRTGRSTAVVRSATRPVPLDYAYVRTPVHETIEALVAAGRAPIYVVHFTQKDAVARAQALTSTPVATRAERDRVSQELAGFRFLRLRPSPARATSGRGSACITPDAAARTDASSNAWPRSACSK